MNSWAFFGVLGEPHARERVLERPRVAHELEAAGLGREPDCGPWSLFTSLDAPRLYLPRQGGAILGRLYRSASTSRAPVCDVRDIDAGAVARGGPRHLVERHWGGYVAILHCPDRGEASLLRDPSGAVPVYFTAVDGARIFVSDPDLLLRLGLVEPAIDRSYLCQWLLYRHLRTARTGLAGVSELLPGTAWICHADAGRVGTIWSPWPFADRRRQFTDFDEAASALRSTALRTIPTYAAGAGKILLELSGGLDSSIVAASLSNAGTRFAAVNFVTRSPDGDERRYARLAAAAAGADLMEVRQSTQPGDILHVPRRLIRPGLSPVLEPIHEAFAAAARKAGAELFLSGAGGDSVFCYLATAAPVLDALRHRGPASALRTLSDVSRLCGCTLWTTAHHAWRKFLRGSASPWPTDRSFLTRAAAEVSLEPHPWLDAPRGAFAGKRQHVEAIVTIFYFLDKGYRGPDAAVAYPLLAQPLVELCLSIPTWMWVAQGRNRAVARKAFEGLVPKPILLRGGKGRLESMCAEAYARSRPDLRHLLLDGRLAEGGLIDRVSVENFLRQPAERSDLRYFRIFDLATLELWLRSWE